MGTVWECDAAETGGLEGRRQMRGRRATVRKAPNGDLGFTPRGGCGPVPGAGAESKADTVIRARTRRAFRPSAATVAWHDSAERLHAECEERRGARMEYREVRETRRVEDNSIIIGACCAFTCGSIAACILLRLGNTMLGSVAYGAGVGIAAVVVMMILSTVLERVMTPDETLSLDSYMPDGEVDETMATDSTGVSSGGDADLGGLGFDASLIGRRMRSEGMEAFRSKLAGDLATDDAEEIEVIPL